jgi:hypothetical protein
MLPNKLNTYKTDQTAVTQNYAILDFNLSDYVSINSFAGDTGLKLKKKNCIRMNS